MILRIDHTSDSDRTEIVDNVSGVDCWVDKEKQERVLIYLIDGQKHCVKGDFYAEVLSDGGEVIRQFAPYMSDEEKEELRAEIELAFSKVK